MAALFPGSLYTTDATILNTSLSQTEWQQAVYEIEAIEAELGITPSATANTVAVFLAALSTGAGLTATGHGAMGTAATHPFSGLTGTFTAAQHGALTTAATHPFSGLTGTFTMAQHGVMSSTAATHGFTAITGTITEAQHGTMASTAAVHGMTAITGTITNAQHGVLTSTAATHGYTALTNIWHGGVFITFDTGGSANNTALVAIPAGNLLAAPTWGILQEQYTGAYPASAGLVGFFAWNSTGQTAIQAHFRVAAMDGSIVASGTHLVTVVVGV